MRISTVAGADSIYSCGQTNTISRSRLPHDDFRNYSLSLKRLIRGLEDSVTDEAWKSILAPLRRYGFSACAAPLPFNDPSTLPADISSLRVKSSALKASYPSQISELQALLDSLV
jgi:hypothetical protein